MPCKNYPLNYQELFELNITPDAGLGNETWARLAAGISSPDPNNNEDVAQDKYLDDEGHGTSTVIGMQRTLSFGGHRVPGDAAQDYIFTKTFELGNERCTQFKRTSVDGNIVSGDVTIANIKDYGGDAGAKQEISFEIHFNGKPQRTGKQGAAALAITVTGGTVAGSTKFAATPTGTNTLAYTIKSVAPASPYYAGQYISGITDYTSDDDIADVLEGQFIWAFEIDVNRRVVGDASHELIAIDIT